MRRAVISVTLARRSRAMFQIARLEFFFGHLEYKKDGEGGAQPTLPAVCQSHLALNIPVFLTIFIHPLIAGVYR
jgi:hypothetical protein